MIEVQSLLQHLIELRNRLTWIILIMILAFLGLLHWSGSIFNFLAQPVLEALKGGNMIITGSISSFFTPIKATFFVAILISLPHSLYQIWAFIAPALYKNEKRLILPLLLGSLALFIAGMAFVYFGVLPAMYQYMVAVQPAQTTIMPEIEDYLDFIIGMFLAFGIAFQLPIAIVLLVRLGVVKIQQLIDMRSYAILAAAVISAVVTPPDVVSMLMLFIPLIILYEAGILIARLVEPKTIET